MTTRLHMAVVALLALCCCRLFHASSAAADASLSPGLRVLQGMEVEAPALLGADGQAVVAVVAGGGAEEAGDGGGGGGTGRMDLELEDYPGSGANDRHSPWWQQQRRN